MRSNVICLIYVLKNTINNKVYIGQTWRPLKERFNYRKNQPYIFNAIKKYGKENFYYEILTVAHTQEIADYWEGYFIDKYHSTIIGYNLRGVGKSKATFSPLTIKKMSEKKLGIPLSNSHKQNLSKAFSGEKNPAAKINENIVKDIYLSFLNDKNITITFLSKKYNLSSVSINSILSRKTWINITKNLPDINVRNKAQGSYFKRSNLTDDDVFNIKSMYATKSISQKSLAEIFHVKYVTIHEIVNNKTWKHIKI